MFKKTAICLIAIYQQYIRQFLPCSCRFLPSCSEYSRLAIGKYGIMKGSALAMKRLLRCHPFSGKSGFDPLI